jgi:hypothetical protein
MSNKIDRRGIEEIPFDDGLDWNIVDEAFEQDVDVVLGDKVDLGDLLDAIALPESSAMLISDYDTTTSWTTSSTTTNSETNVSETPTSSEEIEKPTSMVTDTEKYNKGKRKARNLAGPSRRHSKKREKGNPKRPLTAYNWFFQKERPKICEEHGGHISFEELAKIVGHRWKTLSDAERKDYETLAEEDSVRYREEMDSYEKRRGREGKKGEVCSSPTVKEPPEPKKVMLSKNSSFNVEEKKLEPHIRRVSSCSVAKVDTPRVSTPSDSVTPLRTTTPNIVTPERLCHPGLSTRPSPIPSSTLSKPAELPPSPPFITQRGPNFMSPCPPMATGLFIGGPPTFFAPFPNLCGSGMSILPQSPVLPPPVLSSPQVCPPMTRSHWDPSSPCDTTSGAAVPSGMEVVLPDQTGVPHHYKVEYRCYRMNRSEAETYMKHLQQGTPWTTTTKESKKKK